MKLLTIGEVAGMLGVSIGGLRKWCDEGLVPFNRLPGGHRRWTYEQVAEIKARMLQVAGEKV